MPAPRKRLTEAKILEWADAHRARTGKWPGVHSGRVYGTRDEDWSALDGCLEYGGYGLPGGSSLAKLLASHRGVGRRRGKPRLTVKQILQWADAHHRRTGAVAGVRGETWLKIDSCLNRGARGFRGGTSLARLLETHRGVRHRQYPPRLTIKQVLGWVDAYYTVWKRWPHNRSGPIDGAPGETWRSVNDALYLGRRGFPRGSSLAKLLDRYRR